MTTTPLTILPATPTSQVVCAPGFDGSCASFTATSLSLSYGSKHAFRDVSIQIKPCHLTGIIGPSGCGKTSFLSCLNRMTDLLPCRVTGSLAFGETNLLDASLDTVALRRQVGMIFQKPNPFPMSIHRNIAMPLREHGMKSNSEIDANVEQALRDVGLWDEVKDRLHSSALALSGGQQQRLCIARALALRPAALLLDEPCSALDPIASGVVEDLMLSLRRKYTLIVITHNLAQARRIADDVALFWVRDGSGVLVESGPTEQIFQEPREEITASYIKGIRG